jgi:hypothetical protein
MSKKPKRRQRPEARPARKPFLLTRPIVLLFLAVVTLVYFYRILSPDVMLHATDQISAGIFFRAFQAETMKTLGTFPLWDPLIFGGMPWVDAMHGDIFYPTALLRLVFSPHLVMSYLFIIHVFLAGVLMFFLLREFRLDRWGAALFASSYMFTGSLVSLTYPGHDAKVVIAALLPGMILFIHKGMRRGQFRWFGLGGLLMGLGLLSPHVQMMYYAYMACGVFFLFELYMRYRETRSVPSLLRPVGFFVAMVLLSLGIGAVQLYPSYLFVSKFSPRGLGNRGYEFATSWALPWEDYLSSFIPRFSGFMGSYWGGNPFKINTEYVGIVGSAFAVLALALKKRDRYVKAFFTLFVLFSLMALGGHTPVYRLFYAILPGVNKFRAASMSYFVVAFSVNVLAALGLKALLARKKDESIRGRGYWIAIIVFLGVLLLFVIFRQQLISLMKDLFINVEGPLGPSKVQALNTHYSQIPAGFLRILIIGGIALLACLFHLRNRLKAQGLVLLMVPLLFFDLWSTGWNFLKTVPPPSELYAKDGAVEFLERDDGVYRVFPLYYRVDENYLVRYGEESVGGHHGNHFQRYQEFLGSPETFMFRPTSVPNLLDHPNFVDVLNVKYVLTQAIPRDISTYPDEHRLELARVLNLLDPDRFALVHRYQEQEVMTDPRTGLSRPYQKGFEIYENSNFLERAYLVREFEVLEDEEILRRLKSRDFDPGTSVILEEEPSGVYGPMEGFEGTAEIVRRTPNEVEIQVEISHPAILVYLENWYPAWRAYVDEAEVPIYRADYVMRALEVPEGSHTVRFTYDGSLISRLFVLTLVCIGFIVLFAIFTGRRKNESYASGAGVQRSGER